MSRVHELNQLYYYLNPETKLWIVKTFATSFHGSCLWNLFGEECQKLWRQWNQCVRLCWGLPRTAHTYFIEEISGEHLQSVVIRRFMNFSKSLSKSRNEYIVCLLGAALKDCRSIIGRNLTEIETGNFQNKQKFNRSMPEDEQWRCNILNELLEVKHGTTRIEGFDNDMLKDRLTFVAVT